MLSAQKEEQRLAAVTPKPSMGSIDKFVNSIEALQQRLDGLNTDEITAAETTLKTLEIRLLELQKTVDVVSKLKQRMVAAADAIDKIPLPSLEAIELESSSTSLQLQHLLAPSSKLIPFPRAPKAPKEKPKTVPIDTHNKETLPASNRLPHDAPSVRPRISEHTRPEPQVAEEKSPEAAASLTTVKSREPNDFPPHRPDSEEPGSVSAAQIPPSLEMPNTHRQENTAAPSAEDRLQNSVAPEFPRQDEVATAEFQFTGDRADNASPSETEESVGTPPPKAAPAGRRPVDFDQRLLDDLIQNYGEFAVSPNLPATLEPEPNRQSTAGGGRVDPQSIRKSQLPLNKKDADLDRQLKQIIKDYGEYDLYSQQSPINLKKGVLLAFALLAVLFFAFYFFSSPRATPTAQQEPLTATVNADGTGGSSATTDSVSPIENTSTQQKN